MAKAATKKHKMTAELANSLETFQQACVGFTGPYNDGHDKLCALYSVEPGAEIKAADIEFIDELMSTLTSALESLEGDMEVHTLEEAIDEVREQCEHGNEADYCEVCYPEDEEEEDE
jgi:hypothetical protein